MFIRLLLVMAMLSITGCVAGNTHSYTVKPELDFLSANKKSVTIGVLDRRSAVVSNKVDPDFIGYNRGAYGIPFSITTKSQNPLAADMSKTLVSALLDVGFVAKSVKLLPGTSVSESLKYMSKNGSDLLVLLELNKWEIFVYHATILDHDVVLSVYDKTEKLLAKKDKSGELNLGANPFNAGGYASEVSPSSFARMMEKLFQNRAIADALEK